MYKIIGADGKEYGPIPVDQLLQWIAEGRVNAQTRILPEGATEWKSVGELPEFAAAFSAPPSWSFTPPLQPAFSSTSAAQAVSGPATGLLITAILGIGSECLGLIWQLAYSAAMAGVFQGPMSGLFSGSLGLARHILDILVGLVIFFGALKMQKLENHSLAMLASILAMIPCVSPCCLLGLPIGIWAANVLSRPDVKSAFRE
jgi:hypothetical protein